VPATAINATAPVRMKVRRLAIGAGGIPFGAGRDTVAPAGLLSSDGMSRIDQ
jgi:hypothetical protein